MEERIEIPYELSSYIERLFFEYNASCTLIAFLLRQEDINKDYLDKYIKENEIKYIELEIAKKKVIKDFGPKDNNEYNYEFDFDNHEIIFRKK